MPQNPFDGLPEFLAVVDHGGFSAAARVLGLSVSHVSRQVSSLEDRLGVRLLQRTTRAVRLTEAGGFVHARGRSLTEQWSEARDELGEAQAALSGKLRIAAGGTYGERFVAPALIDFAKLHPALEIELLMAERRVDLVRESVDLAVRLGALDDSSLISRKVAPRNMRLVASPDYLAGAPPLDTIDDLAGHSCLASPDIQWRFREDGDDRVLHPKSRFASTSGPALTEAAIAGLGVTWLAEFYVREAIQDGRLIRLLPDTEVEDPAVWIVYPARGHMPMRVRAAIDWLMEALHPSNSYSAAS
jgi:LysR family transcriptional regulator, transcriptional activator for dmlA